MAQSAAIPVEILTSHQHSARSLMRARSHETASATRETDAQIATRVSNVNSLACRRILISIAEFTPGPVADRHLGVRNTVFPGRVLAVE